MHRWNRFIDMIHQNLWKKVGSGKDRKLEREIRLLYPGKRSEIQESVDRYRKKQIQYVILFVVLAILLLIVGGMSGQTKDKSFFGIFLLLGGVFAYLLLYDRNRLMEKGKERKEQLKEDYPQFVHKLVLYLGAGMNLRKTFIQMGSEYDEDLESGRVKSRYVYEELKRTLYEMEAGRGELGAYEAFSDRLSDKDYGKLLSLLMQNLQKGSEGLLKSLETAEENAFFMRIDRAKKAGEEIGTRLLFPMILMLLVVMTMVMAPAIFQFRGL